MNHSIAVPVYFGAASVVLALNPLGSIMESREKRKNSEVIPN